MNLLLFESQRSNIEKGSEEYNHIKKILKLKIGDTFRYGIYDENIYEATITIFDEDKIEFTSKVTQTADIAAFLYPATILLASVRPICLKRMIREIASIGIEQIIIVNGELSEKSYSKSKLYQQENLEALVLQGAIQSGKTGKTKVKYYDKLSDAIKDNKDKSLYFCDNVVESTDILKEKLKFPLLFAIGSERGFSNKERDLFLNNNFTSISLGNRILRSETASVATATIIGRRYDNGTCSCEK